MTFQIKASLFATLLLTCSLGVPATISAQEPSFAMGCTQEGLQRDERIAACEMALDEATSDEQKSMILSSRAGMYAEADDLQKALSDLGTALALDPKNSDAWIRSSSLSLRLGSSIDALAQASMATKLAPENPSAHLYRAIALSSLDPTGCVEDATAAIQLAMTQTKGEEDLPKTVKLLSTGSLTRGNCHLAQGAAELALSDLLAARALDPERGVGASLVDTYIALKQTASAMTEVDAFEAKNPGTNADYMRFMVQQAAGDDTAALELIRKAHEADPENPSIINDLAWTLFLAGDFDEANALLEPLFTNQESIGTLSTHVTDTYAHVVAAMGETEKAVALFGVAVKLAGTPELENYAKHLARFGFELEGPSKKAVGPALQKCVTDFADACRMFDE